MKQNLIAFALILLLAACTQSEEPLSTTATAVATTDKTVNEDEPTSTAVPNPVENESVALEATAVAPTTVVEAPTEEVPQEETAVAPPAPITVTYFTPSQQEGPYYTVDKPEDRDNDLVDFTGAASLPNGQILEFDGKVYDANGQPIEGITIEIWQTDANGVYLHPGDPGTNSRDPNFQFYGEALTDAAGYYAFRTIMPGHYEPRPRHIHVKVKRDGQELLTTQFYFADELALQGDEAAMLITPQPGQDSAGNPILVGQRDIVLNFTP